MLVLFLFNLLYSQLIDDLVKKVIIESPLIKEIEKRTASYDESYKSVYGKFDLEFYADANYSNQDGGITGNFFMDNVKSSNLDFGFRKKFDYGLSAELNHSLNNTKITSSIIGQRNTYLPVVNASLRLDLLKNFLGKLDSVDIESASLKSKKNILVRQVSIDKYLLDVLSNFLKTKAIKDQIEVAKILVSSTGDLFKVVNRKFKIGSAEKRNLLYAETNYQGSQENLLETQRLYYNSVSALNAICGIEVNDFLEPKIEENYLENLFSFIEKQTINNLELSSLNYDVKLTKNELIYRKNYLLPLLALQNIYSFGGANESISSAYDKFPNRGLFIGLNFVWDISNTSPKYLQRSSELYLEALNFNIMNMGFYLDKDLDALKNSIASYYEQKKIIDSKYLNSAKRLGLELSAFENGRSSITEVIDAQNSLALAYAEKNNIKYELLMNIYNTAYKKGILSETFSRGK